MSGAAPAPRREDLPDGSVRIVFAAPIILHGEAKGHVDLRPPTAGERWDIGEPISHVYGDGAVTPWVDRAVLRKWIDLLMVGHDADVIARERDAALGILIEEAVLDFFAKARKRLMAASALSSATE